jgi:hypothetical protein
LWDMPRRVESLRQRKMLLCNDSARNALRQMR